MMVLDLMFRYKRETVLASTFSRSIFKAVAYSAVSWTAWTCCHTSSYINQDKPCSDQYKEMFLHLQLVNITGRHICNCDI